MENPFIQDDPMLYGDEDQDPLDLPDEKDAEEINNETRDAIEELKQDIYSFKKQLFSNVVSNDKKHDASDLGPMMTFHALYLQTVGYWIGLLDGRPVPSPTFSQKKNTATFLDLTRTIQTLIKKNSDARILVYSMLFNFSVQHPFELGKQKSK